MLLYVAAFRNAAAAGERVTDRAIASRIGCRYQTVSEWRRKPGFNEWVGEQFLTPEAKFAQSMLAVAVGHRALQGSVPHAKLFLKLTGVP